MTKDGTKFSVKENSGEIWISRFGKGSCIGLFIVLVLSIISDKQSSVLLTITLISVILFWGFLGSIVIVFLKKILKIKGRQTISCADCGYEGTVQQFISTSELTALTEEMISKLNIIPSAGMSFGKQGVNANLGTLGLSTESPGIIGKFDVTLLCGEKNCDVKETRIGEAEIRIWKNMDGTDSWELKGDYRIV